MILKNKTLKFNRLDQVDDLEEGNIIVNGVNFSRYHYVSCWTDMKEESIPLWRLYTKGNSGIRISVDSEVLFPKFNVADDYGKIIVDNVDKLMIPPKDVNNSHYFVFPGIWFYKVRYVDDVQDKIRNFDLENGKVISEDLGIIKNKVWSFQNEYRFILKILPRTHNQIPMTKEDLDSIMVAISKGKEPEVAQGMPKLSHFLSIDEAVFDSMEITLSPTAEDEHRIMVEALCEKFVLNKKIPIKNSSLCNKIKFKI